MSDAEPGAAASLDEVAAAASLCTRCDLYRHATRTVFGEGPDRADLMLVGEQPGDREDLAGRPFVGPAGAVLAESLAEAGIDRERAWVTNAVKHFKFEPRGRRRIHVKPAAGEIRACRWWLDHEIALVAPRLAVGLGVTALTGLFGRPVRLADLRGRVTMRPDGLAVFGTVHPSYLLRLPDAETRARERTRFVDDLRRAADHLAGRAGPQ